MIYAVIVPEAGAETDDIPGERTARITRQRRRPDHGEEHQILMFDPVYRLLSVSKRIWRYTGSNISICSSMVCRCSLIL